MRPHNLALNATALSAILLLAGCSSHSTANRVGKYIYTIDLKFKGIPFAQKWQGQWVELKTNGTYAARNGKLAASGRYTIQANQIKFTAPTGTIYKGHFRDNVLELDESCFGIKLSSDQTSPEDYFDKAK